jgi:hypothetical protein
MSYVRVHTEPLLAIHMCDCMKNKKPIVERSPEYRHRRGRVRARQAKTPTGRTATRSQHRAEETKPYHLSPLPALHVAEISLPHVARRHACVSCVRSRIIASTLEFAGDTYAPGAVVQGSAYATATSHHANRGLAATQLRTVLEPCFIDTLYRSRQLSLWSLGDDQWLNSVRLLHTPRRTPPIHTTWHVPLPFVAT